MKKMKLLLKYFSVIALLTITHDLFSQNFWQTINGPQGGNYRRIKSNPINNNTYLLTYWNTNHGNGVGGNIFNSTNNGVSWTEIDNGLNESHFNFSLMFRNWNIRIKYFFLSNNT